MRKGVSGFFLCLSVVYSQYVEVYPYHNVVDTVLMIAGGFGELRNSHFHAGIDIRTNEREGMPVYSIDDGYVYRVNISPDGYGKAIYIMHNNGYCSVYGHLSSFSPVIEGKIKSIQYVKHTFSIDTIFSYESAIKVKKGEMIALSGNTGFSTGPHVHFEIRKDSCNKPVNPFSVFFRFNTKTSPVVYSIVIYAVDTLSGASRAFKWISSFRGTDILEVPEVFGIGIQAVDKTPGYKFRLPVYSVELCERIINGGNENATGSVEECRRLLSLDSLSFDEKMLINYFRDNVVFHKKKSTIMKTFAVRGIDFSFYADKKTRGIIKVLDNEVKQLKLKVCNSAMVCREITLYVRGNRRFNYTEDNCKVFRSDTVIYGDRFIVEVPGGAVLPCYDFFVKEGEDGSVVVGNETIPLIRPFKIYIKPLSSQALQKQVIVLHRENGKGKSHYEALPTDIERGWLTANSGYMGAFRVVYDTLPPVIIRLNSRKVAYRRGEFIRMKVYDNLTGVSRIDVFVDGRWALSEYDKKTREAVVLLDTFFFMKCEPRTNVRIPVSVIAFDKVGNRSSITFHIVIKERASIPERSKSADNSQGGRRCVEGS